MIKWMVTETIISENYCGQLEPYMEIIAFDLSNIQTAEAERTMYLEDNPDVSPDNVSVVQYKE